MERASETVRREHVHRAVASLPLQERQVIEMRFGLCDQPPRTRAEVGRELDLTYERVRQIEIHTLKKLKELPAIRDAA
jgi:RNA polymerase primary sigma factor